MVASPSSASLKSAYTGLRATASSRRASLCVCAGTHGCVFVLSGWVLLIALEFEHEYCTIHP